MNRFIRVLCAFALASSVPALIFAEVTGMPFSLPEPVFTEEAAAFPGAYTWMSAEQVLNQGDTPENGHCLDTGALFTFFSSEGFSARGMAREMFQFRPHPDSDFKFWGRALVTDLRLDCSLPVRPFVVSAGYRHDCKHDVNATKRDVIHDALFARLILEEGSLGFLPGVWAPRRAGASKPNLTFRRSFRCRRKSRTARGFPRKGASFPSGRRADSLPFALTDVFR